MRIIKNPNPVEEKIGTCKCCECEFAYTEGDVKTYSYSNKILGPGSYGYRKKYVLCPNCGKEFVIEEHSSNHQDKKLKVSPELERRIREGLETDDDFTMYPHLTEPDEDD